jgi:2-haloacid dehalogenase
MRSSTLYSSSLSRRGFFGTASLSLAALTVSASPLRHLAFHQPKIKAVAFDAFPIFDPRQVFAMVNQLFPEKETELSEIWRTKQFEYSWLRTAGGVYKDFWGVTEDALIFAAQKTGVNITEANRRELMNQYLVLPTWPDVIPALETLKQKGLELALLSNMTGRMLKSCAENAKIDGYFTDIISTDSARTYKPNPNAYHLGIDRLKVKKEEILFVAFAGWDASGAKWFGYPTFWLNRQNTPAEELNAVPDGVGKGMNELVDLILRFML